MITIIELLGALSSCLAAQHRLELCRKQAMGNVEYYAYGYIQDLKLAEKQFEQTLNTYIDQRVAERVEQSNPLGTRPNSPSPA